MGHGLIILSMKSVLCFIKSKPAEYKLPCAYKISSVSTPKHSDSGRGDLIETIIKHNDANQLFEGNLGSEPISL